MCSFKHLRFGGLSRASKAVLWCKSNAYEVIACLYLHVKDDAHAWIERDSVCVRSHGVEARMYVMLIDELWDSHVRVATREVRGVTA